MKTTLSLMVLFALVYAPSFSAQAQTDAGPTWQVLRYDISASAQPSTRALVAHVQITIRNVGRGSGSKLTLRINSKAEIKAATANDVSASFRASQDTRANQQKIEVTLPSAIAPNSTFTAAVDYQMPVTDNSQLSAISPLGVQFLPPSYWYPTPTNPTSPRGGDTAAFRLKVTSFAGDTLLSSGKSIDGAFDQSLNGQPFFLSGSWDLSDGVGEARGISAYLPKGASPDERKQAEAIVVLAGVARTYFTNMFGSAPDVPVRIIGVPRSGGFCDSGTLLLDVASFRRSKIDVVTAIQVAELIARLWIGGSTAVRAEGNGVIREGLVRHLATSFIEKEFGADTAEAERLRQRTAYAADAKRDAPLSVTTALDASYFTTVGNKGAMVWRLVEHAIGREAFIETLRGQLQSGAGEGAGLTLASFRAALSLRGGDPIKTLLQYEMDQPSDTDLLVGLPQARGNEWTVALRNMGALDVSTNVVAIMENGERVKTEALIPARNFGEAVFKTSAKPKRVEVDPGKLYPQTDYANDVVPRLTSGEDPLLEAERAFQRLDYVRAESLLRDFLAVTPNAEEARVLLARSLLAQNKLDQAEKEFRAALGLRAPTPVTLAWANIGLGEINLQRGQAAQAARNFDEAVRTAADYGTALAARAGRIKAEAATKNAPAPDESARSFIAQLDKSILSGRKADVEQLIVPGELATFAKAIVGSQPEVWQTQVLRTEQLDATRMAVDVNLTVKQLGRELSGRPVLILARTGGGWKLAGVEFFDEVR